MPQQSARIDEMRKWLGRNKIFFDTIGILLLSLMAIVVTGASVIVAVNANSISSGQSELMRMELEVARIEQLPVIHVAAVQVLNDEGVVDDIQLVVYNLGKPLSHFSYDNAEFLDVYYSPEPAVAEEVRVPIRDYYTAGIKTAEPVNRQVTLIGDKNNKLISEIERGFMDFAHGNNAIGHVQLVSYVQVRYRDLLQEDHVEYYSVTTLGAHRIEDAEGQRIFEQRDEARRTGTALSVFDLTPDLLLKEWEARTRE